MYTCCLWWEHHEYPTSMSVLGYFLVYSKYPTLYSTMGYLLGYSEIPRFGHSIVWNTQSIPKNIPWWNTKWDILNLPKSIPTQTYCWDIHDVPTINNRYTRVIYHYLHAVSSGISAIAPFPFLVASIIFLLLTLLPLSKLTCFMYIRLSWGRPYDSPACLSNSRQILIPSFAHTARSAFLVR